MHRILLHQNFLDSVHEQAAPKSKLREEIQRILTEIRENPRARKFRKLWTFQILDMQVVTRRAHFGSPGGYRLIFGIFQHRTHRRVAIVPLLLRKDEDFRYEHKALSQFVDRLASDYLDDERRASRYRDWEGEL